VIGADTFTGCRAPPALPFPRRQRSSHPTFAHANCRGSESRAYGWDRVAIAWHHIYHVTCAGKKTNPLNEPTSYSPRHFSTSAPFQSCKAPASLCRHVSETMQRPSKFPCLVAGVYSLSFPHLPLISAPWMSYQLAYIFAWDASSVLYHPRNVFSLSVSHLFAAFLRHFSKPSSPRLVHAVEPHSRP